MQFPTCCGPARAAQRCRRTASLIAQALCLIGAAIAALILASPADAATPRLWTRVTPAAGVPIRSAPNFRVYAVSTSGTTSVDIYQLNSDGSSTKLGSIGATTTGTYSTGSYTTQNMAAVYWQFTSLPAASTDPPPVSVTFINDAPAIPLSSLYYPSFPSIPFAAGDPSLLLDIDLRNGAPAGWSVSGSGTFDPTNGYTPGTDSASGIADTLIPAFASSASLSQGSFVIRFQRTGVSTDDSFGTHFWDSTGNTLNATTQSRQLFSARSNSAPWGLAALVQAAATPYFHFSVQTASGISAVNWQTLNSHFVPGYHDPVFADLLFTWYQNQYYLFFDGHLFAAGSLADVPVYQMFQNICIGNFNGAGSPSGVPFGGYFIRQLQVSSRFLGPVLAGPTIGLLPDSFAQAYTQRASPLATGPSGTYQVADIDAVQDALGLYSGLAALYSNPGQTAPFHQIQALMFESYGFFPPIYNAGEAGHGYSHINSPIDDAFIAGLNQATPSVVMAGGTVNDVSPFKPADANLIADTEAVMNRLVLGGGASLPASANPALEQIVYLETLSSQAMPGAGPYPEPAYANESQNIITLTRANLPAFVPSGGVAFNYLTSREWWNEAPDYPSYLYGSAPVDPFNMPGGNDYQNVHPDPTGYSIIAAHLYAPIASAVMNTAAAALVLQGTAVFGPSNLSTYTITVANHGPLSAAGAIVTSVVPSGTVLVGAGTSNGCSQNGNTVSCSIGPLAVGMSSPLNVVLQTTGSVPTALTFAAAAGNASSANSTNNATIAPVPAAPASVQAVATDSTSVTVSWPASAGAQSYSLFEGASPTAISSTPVSTGIKGTSFNITGLSPGQTYYLVVAAVNGGGPSVNSPLVKVTLPPSVPADLRATAGDGSVALNWDAATGAASYEVFQGTASGGEGTSPVSSGVTATSVTISKLDDGQTYYFTVKAVSSAGTSKASAEVASTPSAPPAPPAPPTPPPPAPPAPSGGGGGAIDIRDLAWLAAALLMRHLPRRRAGRAIAKLVPTTIVAKCAMSATARPGRGAEVGDERRAARR
jgi:uncharacterized repeat protein (TIGR01451 family)